MYSADISADDLVGLVRAYNPKTNEKTIRAAFDFGREMHEGQFRHSGEPYFTHPVAVAAILAEQQLDDATIVTALLHDTIEDTRASYADVERLFGSEVAELVDGVTKLTNLQLTSTETKQAENFRKLFMAMSKDMRVILVKLADRLHNMRTIKAMNPDKQGKKSRETMEIFAPLAGRIGMQWMREELEDLAFKVLNPEGRASIMRRFITLQRETGDVIQKITGDMRTELDKVGIEAEVYGRAKKPYSIWRKMQEKQLSFNRLSDIYGFRIITGSEGRLLPHPRRDPWPLARGARTVQGLHQPAQVQRLPFHPHHCFGPGRQAGGGSDPHPPDARRGRERRGGSLVLPRRCAVGEPLRGGPGPLDRAAVRAVRRRGEPRGLPRSREARDVRRPGLLLHAQGRGGEAAAWRHPD